MKFYFNWPSGFWENYVGLQYEWIWLKGDLWNLFIDTRLNISSDNNDLGFHSIQNINFSKNFPFKCINLGSKFDLDVK